MSYFEWVKNLSHVRFGRMLKRHEMANERAVLRVIELATGKIFTEEERTAFAQGPERRGSGQLGPRRDDDHRVSRADRDTRSAPGVPDLRIAAFVEAIHKIARSYMELGIFP